MRDLGEKEIVDALRDEPAAPPAGLAQKLKDQIPSELFEGEEEGPTRGWARGPWLAAAAAVVAVMGTFLVSRSMLGPDLSVDALVERAALQSRIEPSEEQTRRLQALSEPVSVGQAKAAADADLLAAEADQRAAVLSERREEKEGLARSLNDELPAGRRDSARALEKDSAVAPPSAVRVLRGGDKNKLGAPENEPLRLRREALEPESVRLDVEMKVQAVAEEIVVTSRARKSRPASYLRIADVADAPHSPRAVPPSTGGTTEPNDAPYGDTFFRSAGVNPFIDTDDDPLSTFGVDVDTASYAVARSYLVQGYLPPPEAIRVEELLNYFDYRDPAPRRGDFSIHVDAAPTPFSEGPLYRLLRFGIVAREVDSRERKPAVLTFLVDVSGSMQRQDRLGSVRQSLLRLLGELRPHDRVGLVIYGDSARVLLEPSSDHDAIRSAIYSLRSGGSTNLEHGLRLAYDVAARTFDPSGVNRVILCSDGVANVGATSADALLRSVADGLEKGIEISTVGFGLGNYNDILMEKLADSGNGNYFYVDSWQEAERVFVENLTGMLQTIGRDAKIQVEFDPSTVSRYRLLGYENRAVRDDRFRDPSVDAGEIGAGHRVTALYEIKLQPGARPRQEVATLRLRYENDNGRIEELEQSLDLRDISRSWEQGSDALRLAGVVAEFAEILKHSYWARDGRLDDVIREAEALSRSGDYRGDETVEELVDLVRVAARLQRDAPEEELRQ